MFLSVAEVVVKSPQAVALSPCARPWGGQSIGPAEGAGRAEFYFGGGAPGARAEPAAHG